jgi:hypothetical protein
MILVEVIFPTAKEQEFKYKKESTGAAIGDTGAFYRQHILVSGHSVNGFPATNARDATITLGIVNKTRGGIVPQSYPVGLYVISPDAVYFDRDEITFGRVTLQPLVDYLSELSPLLQTRPELRKYLEPQKQAA